MSEEFKNLINAETLVYLLAPIRDKKNTIYYVRSKIAKRLIALHFTRDDVLKITGIGKSTYYELRKKPKPFPEFWL